MCKNVCEECGEECDPLVLKEYGGVCEWCDDLIWQEIAEFERSLDPYGPLGDQSRSRD